MVFTNNCGDSCSVTEPLEIKAMQGDGAIETRAASTQDALSGLTCFPNPADRQLTIRWTSAREVSGLRIYDLSGAAIYTEQFTGRDGQRLIDVSQYPSGMYQVVLTLKSGDILSKSVMIQR